MDAEPLASILDATADACHLADPEAWSPESCDLVLRGIDYVAVEIVGLAARVRASRVHMAQKVNDTPRPLPMKPLAKPDPKPSPKPQPKPDDGDKT